MRWQAVINVLFLVAIDVLLSSCSGSQLKSADLQGTWVAESASQQRWIKSRNVCQIVLRADGTFAASVPDYLMTTFDQASGKVKSGTGQ
jgi:hypothetical protein